MNFDLVKKKALELKKKAIKMGEKAVDYSAEKLASSSFTINTKEKLDEFIKKSVKTKFKNKETWVEKEYSHKVIVLFWDEKTEFFKKALYQFPVITTKWFTQNIAVKLAKHNIKWVDLKAYNIDKIPSVVVFQDTKLYKTISWEENVLKLVKWFDLDINKVVEEF